MALLALLLGGGMFLHAVHRLTAQLPELEALAIRERLAAVPGPSAEALHSALAAQRRAEERRPTAEGEHRRGELFSALARREDEGGAERGRASWEEARAAYRASLAHHPGSSRVWLGLAMVELRLAGYSPAALEALRLSIEREAFDPDVLYSRLTLGLSAWSLLSPPQRRAVERQFETAWAYNTTWTLQAIPKVAGALERVRGWLADRPEALRRLDVMQRHFAETQGVTWP
ncbi:MAG: hypothetical protein HQL51_12770 [Magnetococcales bacterium]|nr:hypothetical protein [Magnetococcales bacterium]